MNETIVARRYAQALYQEAQQAGIVAEVDDDMTGLAETFRNSRELALFFASPLIAREKKEAVVDRLFSGRVHPLVNRFIRLLIDKGREGFFPAIARAYRTLRDEQLGITEANVRVAAPLSPEEEAHLDRALADLTGKQVRTHVHVDPDLIGGAVVRVGDTVYDGSLRHQLSLLREQLERGT